MAYFNHQLVLVIVGTVGETKVDLVSFILCLYSLIYHEKLKMTVCVIAESKLNLVDLV